MKRIKETVTQQKMVNRHEKSIGETWMVCKCIQCSDAQIIGETHIKTLMKCHFTLIILAKIIELTSTGAKN